MRSRHRPLIRWVYLHGRARWTKVHYVSFHAEDLTACHRSIPAEYAVERLTAVPDGAHICLQCLAATE